MSVYTKLQKARGALLKMPLKKSGKNKFAGFEYFELGDFIPAINGIFEAVGLCGVVNFTTEMATLTIYDTEELGQYIVFTSPMVFAENSKGQAIQSLGATHTYLRRYLWLMAMEIIENDAIDVFPAAEEKPKTTFKKPAEPVLEAPAAPTQDDMDNALFVDKMIEWGTLCANEGELKELWKKNQSQIDTIKTSNTTLFNHLKTCFAEIKSHFGE